MYAVYMYVCMYVCVYVYVHHIYIRQVDVMKEREVKMYIDTRLPLLLRPCPRVLPQTVGTFSANDPKTPLKEEEESWALKSP